MHSFLSLGMGEGPRPACPFLIPIFPISHLLLARLLLL